MIAGNAAERKFKRRQQPLEILILLSRRRVRQISGDHHKIGRRIEFVQCCDTTFERLGGIDPAIGERSRWLDMQVGNLRNLNRF